MRPTHETTKGNAITDRISRCTVCLRSFNAFFADVPPYELPEYEYDDSGGRADLPDAS
jgi:hypothetical protein